MMSVASRDDFIMRFMIFSNACANSLYQALFFVSPRQKKGLHGDEASFSPANARARLIIEANARASVCCNYIITRAMLKHSKASERMFCGVANH